MTHHPKKPWSFDIETAISTWRQFVSKTRSIGQADLDELEIHLRDAFDSARKRGMSEESAFRFALHDLGDVSRLDREFEEVAFEKRIRKGRISMEIKSTLSLAGSYLKGTWRNLTRHPGYSGLNIGGISLALTAALVVGLFVRHSLSYDQFLAHTERTYRIVQDRGMPGMTSRPSDGISFLIRDARDEVEVVTESRGWHGYAYQLSVEDEHYMQEGVMMVDGRFLDVFSFPLKTTSSLEPLDAPDSVILTESTAERLFGKQDPLGQTIRLSASRDLTVTAVAYDPPSNTHLPFTALVRSYNEHRDPNWNRWGSRTYVRLKPGAETAGLETFLNERFAEGSPGAIGTFHLQPITDIHLRSGATDDFAAVSDIRYVYVFSTVGLLILALACINYMNLATARASRRLREVGVRKVVGATAGQLRRQFLTESFLVTSISVPIAILLAALALPVIGRLTGIDLPAALLLEPVIWLGMAALVLFMSVGAGVYPALLMARGNPVAVFSGGRSTGRGRNAIRRTLVCIQVAVSFGIIVSTMLVSSQLDFIQKTNLGFQQDQIVSFSPPGWTHDEFVRFKQEVENHSGVEMVADGPPLGINWRMMSWSVRDESGGPDRQFEAITVGPDYIQTMGIELLEGRFFTADDLLVEPRPVIVSAGYAQSVGADGSIVGTESNMGEGGTIIGVVNEVRNASFHESDAATIFQVDDDIVRTAVAHLAAGRIEDGLQAMESAWETLSPDRPFSYSFLDESIRNQYVAEKRLSNVFRLFTGLSIVIASLGLFGLAAFIAQQRVREIGIRKALGATAGSIVMMLSREFMVLVAVGSAVVTPLVVIYGNRWLANFSEHIPLGPGLFLTAGGAALAFVLVAVGFQAVRAAQANPTEALRHE